MTDSPDAKNLEVLYGTTRPPAPMRKIACGPIDMLLEQDRLRTIRYHGVEVLRGVAFIVRDRNWGTAVVEISDLTVQEEDDCLHIQFAARCDTLGEILDHNAEITLSGNGRLSFRVTGVSETGFTTNRVGFAILHPCERLAGKPLKIRHTDGSSENSMFPDLIMPAQPAQDIEALTWSPAPGISATCIMDDDAYEMEDQRNWSDASFKTYYRPLAKPRPYHIEPGAPFAQYIELCIEGKLSGAVAECTSLEHGTAILPRIALAFDPEHEAGISAYAARLQIAEIDCVFCHFDSGRGHGEVEMANFAKLAEDGGVSLVLDAVLQLKDEDGSYTDDAAILAREAAALAEMARSAGVRFEAVIAVPECYRKSYQPTETWPLTPDLADVTDVVRTAFPDSLIGGGMQSYFTELNRKHPAANADFVTHTFCPIVHAADDLTVMENLGAMPAIARSARQLLPGKPYWIGPSGISMRHNPYADTTVYAPDDRVAMNNHDPRMRAQFGAAWGLGLIASLSNAPPSLICLGSLGGGNAVLELQTDGSVMETPLFGTLDSLAEYAGAPITAIATGEPQCVAIRLAEREVWIANLGDKNRSLQLAADTLSLAPFEVVQHQIAS